MNLVYTFGFTPRTLVVRTDKAELNALPIDSVAGNLQALIFAFKRVEGVKRAHEYRPGPSHDIVVGELMPDGADAYRIEIEWDLEADRADVVLDLLNAYRNFWKVDRARTDADPEMAVYADDGSFDYYIGAGG